jgi:predicted small lipoprotein YifL
MIFTGNWSYSMLSAMKLLKTTTLILLLSSLTLLFGCAHAKPYYFNDSDKVFAGDANKQPPTPTFDWVLMSKGKYRTITTVNPQ